MEHICQFVIVKKYWFLQVYWLNDDGKSSNNNLKKYKCIKQISSSFKTWGFLRDPVAYFTVLGLALPFLAFFIGTYLPDNAINDQNFPRWTNIAAQTLGPLFFFCFLVCKIKALFASAILGMIFVFLLFAALVCILLGMASCSNQNMFRTNRR